MTKQIKETYIHEHAGIEVGVKINYQKKKISLVDTENFKVKHWIFPPSNLEYMEGWINVLNAMQVAIAGAEIKLKVYLDEETEARVEMMMDIGRSINTERE